MSENREPLALTVCPRCDYDLRGLPPVGTCPECGRPYDQKSIILWGWPLGTKQPPLWGMWNWSYLLVYFCDGGRFVWALWAVVLLAPGISWLQTRYSRPITRVKLSAQGCAQYNTPGPAAVLNPNSAFWNIVMLLVLGGVLWRISQNLLVTGVVAALLLFKMLTLVTYHLRLRRLERWKRERGEYFDEFESAAKTAPWREATEVAFASVKKGRCNLMIKAPDRNLRMPNIFVHARILCTDEQRHRIQEQIQEWRYEQAGVLEAATMKVHGQSV